MRKLLLLAVLLTARAPAWAGWSLVANNTNTGCAATSTTCAITVSATTAGDIAIVTMRIGNINDVISSVTDGGSSYGLCPSQQCHGSQSSLAKGIDMAYSLSLTAGRTTVTVTRSSATNSGTWTCRVLQYRTNSGPAYYDKGGTSSAGSPTTAPAGVTLAITSTHDVIVQEIVGNAPNAISGSYTDPATFSGNDGWGGWVNANSGAPPTWTQSNGRAAMSAIAISETVAAGVVRHRAWVIQR